MRVSWKDRSGIDRRKFFHLTGSGLSVVAALVACGIPGIKPKPFAERMAIDHSSDGTLDWSDWQYYIDINEKAISYFAKYPTLNKFHKQTGIKVTYREDISDNDVFFGKIRPLLASGRDPGTDLMVLSDWMASRLIRYGWVQPFNTTNFPNAKNLDSRLPKNIFDPNLEYAAPYVYGVISIAYNRRATGGRKVESITQMLTDPYLRGKIALLSEMESTMSLIMLDNGIDSSNFTDYQFSQCLQILEKAIHHGQVKAFTGNEYTQGLAKGDYAAAVVYSGDVIQLRQENPEIEFVVPSTGAKVYTDNFLIPAYSAHKTNAEKLINFYYDPAISAELYAHIKYLCPISGAQTIMKKIHPELAYNPLIFPDSQALSKLTTFKTLTAAQERDYFRHFQHLIGV